MPNTCDFSVRIACIGWGSLIPEPGNLPCLTGWEADGPELPVEFARESEDGRLTLVLVRGARPSTTLWCQLASDTMDGAVRALQQRERTPSDRSIGRWPDVTGQYPFGSEVGQWAEKHKLDGVVWTALKPGFRANRDEPATLAGAVAHLRGLDGPALAKAARYIRQAPAQIRTEFRAALESELDRLGCA